MKAMITPLIRTTALFLSIYTGAYAVEIFLPSRKISELTEKPSHLWIKVSPPALNQSIAFPISDEFGYNTCSTNFDLSEVLVVAQITKVKLITVTDIDRLGFGSIYFYRVHARLKSVLRGSFPDNSVEFVCQYGFERPPFSWPYVKGFCYYFGLSRAANNNWEIRNQVRTSPLPPYARKDICSYWDWQLEFPNSSASVRKAVEWPDSEGLLDAVVVKEKFVVLTYSGDSIYGLLDMNTNYDGVKFRIFDVQTGKMLRDDDPLYLMLQGYDVDLNEVSRNE